MTDYENRFFDSLQSVAGANYLVFPQVHLSAFLDEKAYYQSWRRAFYSVNAKSVDYVICDRSSRRPVVAVELDDASHSRDDRRKRDAFVEGLLKSVDLPLVRFSDIDNLTTEQIKSKLDGLLV